MRTFRETPRNFRAGVTWLSVTSRLDRRRQRAAPVPAETDGPGARMSRIGVAEWNNRVRP
ncbi:hypothetical protein GCM10009730_60520 [Streptomyces albidochromogenes]